jgi:hypothetical protein
MGRSSVNNLSDPARTGILRQSANRYVFDYTFSEARSLHPSYCPQSAVLSRTRPSQFSSDGYEEFRINYMGIQLSSGDFYMRGYTL